MKLNPPETAPKGGTMILAKFDFVGQGLLPAIWNPGVNGWSIARIWHMPRSLGYKHSNIYGEDTLSRLIGWLPMPRVEGNEVVF